MPDAFLSETRILEMLRRNQHPNIVNYHDVRVRVRPRGPVEEPRITGIMLENYPNVDAEPA